MKIIRLPKKKFEQLQPLELSRNIINTEGELYSFDYRGQSKVVKELYNLSGTIFANKLYTLEMLDTNKEYLPNNFCYPDNLISVDDTIVGFTIPRIYGENLVDILSNPNVDYKEQLYYLKKVGTILEQLKSIRKYSSLDSFYLNDLHAANFIVNPNNKDIYVIDLDSCKIGNNIAFPAKYLTPRALLNNVPDKYKINNDTFIPGYVTADSNSDLYCYNIMVLNYLYGENINNVSLDSFYDYLNYLEYLDINHHLISTFARIVDNVSNKNPLYYLDTLTESQRYRAKKNIYKNLKKKS